jgi:hypothetical protein
VTGGPVEVVIPQTKKQPPLLLELEEEDLDEEPLAKRKKRIDTLLRDSPTPSPSASPSVAEEFGMGFAEVPPLSPEVQPLGTHLAEASLEVEQVGIPSTDTTLAGVPEDALSVDMVDRVEQTDAPAIVRDMTMVLFGADTTGPVGSPVAATISSPAPGGSSAYDEGMSLKREVFPELEEVVPAGPRWTRPTADTLGDVYRPGIVSSLYVLFKHMLPVLLLNMFAVFVQNGRSVLATN